MNEPYQRVDDTKTTQLLGNMARDIGVSVGMTAATEVGLGVASKRFKDTKAGPFLQQASRGEGNWLTAGISTKKGRIVGYGTSILGGAITGALRSNQEQG